MFSLHTLLTTDTKLPLPQVNWTLFCKLGTRNLHWGLLLGSFWSSNLMVSFWLITILWFTSGAELLWPAELNLRDNVQHNNNITVTCSNPSKVCFLTSVILQCLTGLTALVTCHVTMSHYTGLIMRNMDTCHIWQLMSPKIDKICNKSLC